MGGGRREFGRRHEPERRNVRGTNRGSVESKGQDRSNWGGFREEERGAAPVGGKGTADRSPHFAVIVALDRSKTFSSRFQ